MDNCSYPKIEKTTKKKKKKKERYSEKEDKDKIEQAHQIIRIRLLIAQPNRTIGISQLKLGFTRVVKMFKNKYNIMALIEPTKPTNNYKLLQYISTSSNAIYLIYADEVPSNNVTSPAK